MIVDAFLHIGSITGGLSSITLTLHNGNADANMNAATTPQANVATSATISSALLFRRGTQFRL